MQNNYLLTQDQLIDFINTYSKHKIIKNEHTRPHLVAYFLCAYYAGSYASITTDNLYLFSDKPYPKKLADITFNASHYGPRLNHAYDIDKILPFIPPTTELSEHVRDDVFTYLKEILTILDNISDFGLIERSYEDLTLRNAYEMKRDIDFEEMRKEYKKI